MNRPPSTKGRPSLDALTGLRFFAAISVVIYHFAQPAIAGWPWPLVELAGKGYVAVSFFFLLSGFLLSYSYLSVDGKMRGTWRSFYVARFARIYPVYFLAFLLAAPHDIATSVALNPGKTAAAKLLLGATTVLTLQQAWTPWTAWAWNYPAWSVSVEAFFYLVFPWLGQRLARLRLKTCFTAAAGFWLLSLTAPVLLFLFKGTTGAPDIDHRLLMAVEFTPLLRLPEFAVGILLGRAYRLGLPFRLRGGVTSYCAMAAILAILAFCPSIPHAMLATGLLLPLFALLVLALAQGQGWLAHVLSTRTLVVLGEASYGIYILQIPVAYVLRVPPPHTSLRTFGVYCVILLATSVISWRFVETPLRGWLRRTLMRETPAPSSVKLPQYG